MGKTKKFRIVLDGVEHEVEVEELNMNKAGSGSTEPSSSEKKESTSSPKDEGVKKLANPVTVDAPLLGSIVDVLVSIGDVVKKGQVLIILEAMKMENEIVAPACGTVSQILVQKGSQVSSGDPLLILS